MFTVVVFELRRRPAILDSFLGLPTPKYRVEYAAAVPGTGCTDLFFFAGSQPQVTSELRKLISGTMPSLEADKPT